MKGRLRLFAAALLTSTMMWPAQAHALPVLGFLGGLLSSFGLVTPLIGLGAIGAVNAGFALGTFLSSGLGSLLLSVGISALQYLNRPRAPSVESARVNVRVPEPERWIIGGRVRSGGAALFGEYDEDGNFWYLVVHGDSELVGAPIATILDEITVAFDANNRVTTGEFTENQKDNGPPVFTVWTVTYTPSNPVPPPLADFKAAFPAWTDDHKLAGTTYSVIRCKSLKAEDRYKVMTWRGPIGIGEPSISIVGDWSRMYDPRDPTQDINDRSTWKASNNAELVWAWYRTHPYGRNKPMSSINWGKVAENADICDQTVIDKNGNPHARYQCGIAVPDSKERSAGEAEIQLSCDGVIVHDSEGKAYLKVGHWEEPSLSLSRRRDILAMASREAQDGETETDGVIVRYMEPEFNWIAQPSAAWKNPRFYQDGRTPRYMTVDILACHDHNQAMRLAKAIGETSQAPYRLLPTVLLRGLRARRERIVELSYDDTWDGPHKIATTVELDDIGATSSFGLVPITPDHWTLLPGEEGDKPAPVVSIEYDKNLPLATNVVVTAAPVPGSGGNSVRLEATFDASPRVDRRYEFEYRKAGTLTWKPMVVLMDDLVAYSDTVDDGTEYEVQWRTVTLSGRASDWKDPPATVTAVADTVAPVALSSFGVTGGLGSASLSFVTAPDDHLRRIAIYRVPHGGVLDRNTHEVTTIGAVDGTTMGYIDGDATRTNLATNPGFDSDTAWTKDADWTISGGAAHKAAGGGNRHLYQSVSPPSISSVYRWQVTVSSYSAGSFFYRISNGTTSIAQSSAIAANGTYRGSLQNGGAGANRHGPLGASTAVGDVDNVTFFLETVACAPQGVWDYYAEPQNGSRKPGPLAGPVAVTII